MTPGTLGHALVQITSRAFSSVHQSIGIEIALQQKHDEGRLPRLLSFLASLLGQLPALYKQKS